MAEWINVKDRLPKNDRLVLSICMNAISDHTYPYGPKEAMFISFCSSFIWWDNSWPEKDKDDNIIHDVTHWMELPNEPKI